MLNRWSMHVVNESTLLGHICEVGFYSLYLSFIARLRPVKVYILCFCKVILWYTKSQNTFVLHQDFWSSTRQALHSWTFVDASFSVCVLRYDWMHFPRIPYLQFIWSPRNILGRSLLTKGFRIWLKYVKVWIDLRLPTPWIMEQTNHVFKLKLWNNMFCFTVKTNSRTTLTATKIKHCFVGGDKIFPQVVI
jgi:hypothetical protein